MKLKKTVAIAFAKGLFFSSSSSEHSMSYENQDEYVENLVGHNHCQSGLSFPGPHNFLGPTRGKMAIQSYNFAYLYSFLSSDLTPVDALSLPAPILLGCFPVGLGR